MSARRTPRPAGQDVVGANCLRIMIMSLTPILTSAKPSWVLRVGLWLMIGMCVGPLWGLLGGENGWDMCRNGDQ